MHTLGAPSDWIKITFLCPSAVAEPHILSAVCTAAGTLWQVNKALEMIKRKFPVKRFPGIDYDRSAPDVPVLPADVMQVMCCFTFSISSAAG